MRGCLLRLHHPAEDRYEVVVVDTPPTGLTLRVLGLSRISLLWLDRLIGLRGRILSLRGMVTHVQGPRTFEVGGERVTLPHRGDDDPILVELHAARGEIKALEARLADVSTTGVVVVMNPESLPLLESLRTVEALTRFGIPTRAVVVNKVVGGPDAANMDPSRRRQQSEILDRLHREVSLPILMAGLERVEVRGLDRLRAFQCPVPSHLQPWIFETEAG